MLEIDKPAGKGGPVCDMLAGRSQATDTTTNFSRQPWRSTPADRYEAALQAFVPFEEPDDTRALRLKLMAYRDRATQALCSAQHHSDEILCLARIVLLVASNHCFRSMSREQLEDAERACLRLFRASAAVARLETIGKEAPYNG